MNNETLACVRLFQAVINQALMDAHLNGQRGEDTAARKNARAWLRGTNREFIEVCMLAGFDPSVIRSKAKAHMDRQHYQPGRFVCQRSKKGRFKDERFW
jgi:hypothetical protein